MESLWLQQRDALATLLLAVLVAAALGAIAYIRPVRRAETARDDGAALRCTVDDRALVPDGSRTRIETTRLVGEVRFAQRREGKARCAIAVAARPMAPLPPKLWFGVEVSEGESEPPRAFRALAGTLLTLARRLMGTDVRCELNTARPLVAFDVASAATRFEAWPWPGRPSTPRRASRGPEPSGRPGAGARRGEGGRHLALAWYTSYVDFERWTRRPPGGWGAGADRAVVGNRGLRLVLFGDGPDGARDTGLK